MRKMLLQLICVLAAPTALALSSAPVAAGPIGSFASGAESWTGAHNVNLVKFRRYRNYGYYAPRYTPPPVVYYPAPVVREYVAPPVVYDDVDVIYAPAPRAPYYTGW